MNAKNLDDISSQTNYHVVVFESHFMKQPGNLLVEMYVLIAW